MHVHKCICKQMDKSIIGVFIPIGILAFEPYEQNNYKQNDFGGNQHYDAGDNHTYVIVIILMAASNIFVMGAVNLIMMTVVIIMIC